MRRWGGVRANQPGEWGENWNFDLLETLTLNEELGRYF